MKRNNLLVATAVISIIETVLSFMTLICSITLKILVSIGISFTSEWFTETENAEALVSNILIVGIVLIAVYFGISLYCSFIYLANCSKSYEKMHEKITPMAIAIVLNYVKLGLISASLALAGASKTGEKEPKTKPQQQQAQQPQQPQQAQQPQQQQHVQQPQQQAIRQQNNATANRANAEMFNQINALKKLRDEGKISEEEFQKRRNDLVKPQ